MAKYVLHVGCFDENWMKDHETEIFPVAGDRICFFPSGQPEDALQVVVTGRFFQGANHVDVYTEVDGLFPTDAEGMRRLGFEI